MAFCERNPAQGTMWHVKNSIFALFSFFLVVFTVFLG